MTTPEGSQTTVQDGVLLLSRVIRAPRHLVFEAWTKAEHLVHWWGRKEYTLPVCTVDFRTGGGFRICMRLANGEEHWVRGTYREIVEPELIVMRCALECDEKNHDALWTITFKEVGAGTALMIRQELIDTEQARAGAAKGLSLSLDRLVEYLTQVAPSGS